MWISSILSIFRNKPIILDNTLFIDKYGRHWKYYSNGDEECITYDSNGNMVHTLVKIPFCRSAKKAAMDNIKKIIDKPLIRNKKIDDILK